MITGNLPTEYHIGFRYSQDFILAVFSILNFSLGDIFGCLRHAFWVLNRDRSASDSTRQ